jgi:hypothetical protein
LRYHKIHIGIRIAAPSVLLMAAGGTSLSNITKLHADKGVERLLGREN